MLVCGDKSNILDNGRLVLEIHGVVLCQITGICNFARRRGYTHFPVDSFHLKVFFLQARTYYAEGQLEEAFILYNKFTT